MKLAASKFLAREIASRARVWPGLAFGTSSKEWKGKTWSQNGLDVEWKWKGMTGRERKLASSKLF